MQIFEYLIVSKSTEGINSDKWEEYLNELGKDRWELITILFCGGGRFDFYFKRIKL